MERLDFGKYKEQLPGTGRRCPMSFLMNLPYI